MKSVKIKCPAKINLTLEVVNQRKDGFHNIKSVMQMISLYDYLTINISDSDKSEIILDGSSKEIPYNEKNLVYKAAKRFIDEAKLDNKKIEIFIDKNIPVAAGLAGGSTDAAGTLYGLNYLLEIFDNDQINQMCAELGSDLNVCLNGGCCLATSRGEITEPLPVNNYAVTLIKPAKLGISAKDVYTKYAANKFKPKYNMTEKLINALKNGSDIRKFLYNDLEYAIFDDYPELQKIKKAYPNSVMSGSGSTYFVLDNIEQEFLDNSYIYIHNLKFIPNGIEVIV